MPSLRLPSLVETAGCRSVERRGQVADAVESKPASRRRTSAHHLGQVAPARRVRGLETFPARYSTALRGEHSRRRSRPRRRSPRRARGRRAGPLRRRVDRRRLDLATSKLDRRPRRARCGGRRGRAPARRRAPRGCRRPPPARAPSCCARRAGWGTASSADITSGINSVLIQKDLVLMRARYSRLAMVQVRYQAASRTAFRKICSSSGSSERNSWTRRKATISRSTSAPSIVGSQQQLRRAVARDRLLDAGHRREPAEVAVGHQPEGVAANPPLDRLELTFEDGAAARDQADVVAQPLGELHAMGREQDALALGR